MLIGNVAKEKFAKAAEEAKKARQELERSLLRLDENSIEMPFERRGKWPKIRNIS